MRMSSTIRIADRASLEAVDLFLRDSQFARDDLRYNKKAHELRLRVSRPDLDLATYESILWCFSWRLVPWRCWELTIRQVEHCEIYTEGDPPYPPYFEVSGIVLSEQWTIRIETHYTLSCMVLVSHLDGILTPGSLDGDKLSRYPRLSFRS